MAFRSLKIWFETFRKSYYPDCCTLYKNFIYDEWFDSLSEDEQKEEIKRQKHLKEKRKQEGREALMRLAYMTNKIRSIHNEPMSSYMDLIKMFMI